MWWVLRSSRAGDAGRVFHLRPTNDEWCRLSYGVTWPLRLVNHLRCSARRRTSRSAGSWRGRPWRWPAPSARRTRRCFGWTFNLRRCECRGRARDRACSSPIRGLAMNCIFGLTLCFFAVVNACAAVIEGVPCHLFFPRFVLQSKSRLYCRASRDGGISTDAREENLVAIGSSSRTRLFVARGPCPRRTLYGRAGRHVRGRQHNVRSSPTWAAGRLVRRVVDDLVDLRDRS